MAAKPTDMERLLECCICLGECQDPRVLPCLHSLCRHCLEDHISSSAQGGRYQCPACRCKCDVPAEGASGVPKNFFMNTLRDMVKGQTESKGVQDEAANRAVDTKTQDCSNKDQDIVAHSSAIVFCVECTKYLCSNCKIYHNMLVSSDHELKQVSATTAREARRLEVKRQKPRCEQHPALEKDMYCDTCHVPMCMKCCLLKHKQHEYRELDDLAEETKAKLAELTQTAEKRYSILGEHLKKLGVTKKTMKGDAEKACAEVSEATEELIDLLNQRKKTLIQEIKDIHALATTEVNAAYKETELNRASIQSLLSYITALQASGDVNDQVVHTPGLQQQLRQQETSPLKSFSWTVDYKRNTGNVATIKTLLGTVSKEQTVDRPVSVGDDKKVKLGPSLLTLTPNIITTCSGISKVGDCVCVVGNYGFHVWMHNVKTNNSKQHTVRNLSAVGMARLGNNSDTLVITDHNKKLHLFTIDPQNMNITKQLTRDISFVPRRVVYDHTTDRLIIANYSDKEIVICSKIGDIEKRITVKTKLNNMLCALPIPGDAFIVLDYSNRGRVHWVNQSGDYTHTYGDGAGERLNEPYNMLQDSHGRLLVADLKNHCVRLITNQQFSHDLLTQSDGINRPSCVDLDETAGTLYVGYESGGEHKLSMYKWPFTPTSYADISSRHGHSIQHFKLCVNLGRYQ